VWSLADGEINLLTGKLSDLERDLDLERRKTRDLQETSRERDKEYQKLKAQYDKLKRRALLAPTVGTNQPGINLAGVSDLPAGVGGIDMNGVRAPSSVPFQDVPYIHHRHMFQRPVGIPNLNLNRTGGPGQFGNTPLATGGPPGPLWSNHPLQQQQHGSSQNAPPVRQPFVASERSLGASERSNSTQEVEELLGSQGRLQRTFSYQGGWVNTPQAQQQRAFTASSARRPSGVFRPGGKSK